MTNYKISYDGAGKYNAVVYSNSCNNPIYDIEVISSEISTKLSSPCYILFDLLLTNGENFNRFAEGYFNGTSISFDSVNVIEINNQDIIQAINRYYSQRYDILNNSILTATEKFKYAKS